jgi:molybdopterin molybdotransferase
VTDNSTDQPTEVVPDPAAAPDQKTLPVKGSGLRSVADQLAKVLDSIGSLDPIQQPLLDAQGLLLAEEIIADGPLPSFDNSAMDGYAVRAVDLKQASADKPVVLPVVGDVVAGTRAVSGMGPGLCMRIMTGAPIPPGADAVIPLEDTDRGVAKVAIFRSARTGECVRRAGEDLAAGAIALGPGAALGPQQIALLAAVGHDRVLVRPRPRVVVISTGSELVEVGRRPTFGEISDSNSYMLAAAARDAGADAFRVGIVPDDHAKLLDTLDSQLSRADLIITSGGVSMGAYDVVKEALSQLGTVEFTRIAMQPGMPQGFGHLGRDRTPIFCLPGNPVSSLVSFEVFVRPAIRKLLGKRNVQRQTIQAIALERMESPDGKRQFRRGLLHREPDGRYSVSLVGGHGSHLIAAMAAANCLVVVEEDVTEVVPGSRVTVLPLMLAQR